MRDLSFCDGIKVLLVLKDSIDLIYFSLEMWENSAIKMRMDLLRIVAWSFRIAKHTTLVVRKVKFSWNRRSV